MARLLVLLLGLPAAASFRLPADGRLLQSVYDNRAGENTGKTPWINEPAAIRYAELGSCDHVEWCDQIACIHEATGTEGNRLDHTGYPQVCEILLRLQSPPLPTSHTRVCRFAQVMVAFKDNQAIPDYLVFLPFRGQATNLVARTYGEADLLGMASILLYESLRWEVGATGNMSMSCTN